MFAVQDAIPLLSGPGRLTALGHDSFSLRSYAAGSFLVRVHYSRYLTLVGGGGCVVAVAGGMDARSASTPPEPMSWRRASRSAVRWDSTADAARRPAA